MGSIQGPVAAGTDPSYAVIWPDHPRQATSQPIAAAIRGRQSCWHDAARLSRTRVVYGKLTDLQKYCYNVNAARITVPLRRTFTPEGKDCRA